MKTKVYVVTGLYSDSASVSEDPCVFVYGVFTDREVADYALMELEEVISDEERLMINELNLNEPSEDYYLMTETDLV